MIESRMTVCNSCPFFLKEVNTCKKCACPGDYMFYDEKAVCPEGKWE